MNNKTPASSKTAASPQSSSNEWKIFDLAELSQHVEKGQPGIFEFLRTNNLSAMIYHLPCGSKDMQSPHEEDELYVVLDGKAKLEMNGQSLVVGRGKILFVAANTQHSFFDIEEDLTVLAIFGPEISGN